MSVEINPDLPAAYWDLCAARIDYERAEEFYCGTVDEIYASDKVRKLLNRSGYTDLDNFNMAHIPVDVVADKLVIQAITTEDDSVNNIIEDLWDYNELGEIFPLLHRDACKFGDSYLMVWPVMGEDGSMAVDMTLQDPRAVRVFYDPENDRVKLFAIKSWCEGEGKDAIIRVNLYYPEYIERWSHKGKVPRDNKMAKWKPFSDEFGDSTLPNPTGQVPFFHYRTARVYGTPEHINAYGPQLVINKIISSMVASLDYQAFPQRYVLLDPMADNPNGNEDFNPDWPEDTDAIPQDPRNPSNLTADPGTVWEMTAKSVGQFEATNMANYLGPLDRAIKAMAQATQIPMHAFDSTGDAISGESRRLANGPVDSRVKNRQLSMGTTHRRAFAFALDLLGITEEESGVSIHWEPLEVIDDADGWTTLMLKKDMGVPLEILLVEAGYTQAQAEEWAAAAEKVPTPVQPPVVVQDNTTTTNTNIDNANGAQTSAPTNY